MSVSTDSRYLVARPLTPDEIGVLLTCIDAAGSVGELLTVSIQGIFDVLLADRDQGYLDFSPSNRLDPTRYAIPQIQWEAIVGAVTRRGDQWGAGALLALELVNVFPCSYDDPGVPEPVVPKADYRPEVFELRVSRAATDVIAACETRLGEVARFYGDQSNEYLTALRSWHRQLAALFNSGAGPYTTVSSDGQLSLVVTTASLHFGIVFHGRRRHCLTEGCAAITGTDCNWHAPHTAAVVLDHEHEPSFPMDAPQPGEWSCHS